VEKLRESQTFLFVQSSLPPLESSPSNPNAPLITQEDMMERALIMLSHKAWRELRPEFAVPEDGSPMKTGIPFIDEMEERMLGGKKKNGNQDP